MLHGRRAAFMTVVLRSSDAGNRCSQIFAPQFGKYRMFLVAVQQRFYGRWRFGRLRFFVTPA
jgi:hypothetical protein